MHSGDLRIQRTHMQWPPQLRSLYEGKALVAALGALAALQAPALG